MRSREQLETLVQSHDYNQIPRKMAESTSPETWWQDMEAIAISGMKLQGWEIAQWIALLFDTYDCIEDVEFECGKMTTTNSNGEAIPKKRLLINGRNYSAYNNMVDGQIMDRIHEIDSKETLIIVWNRLNNGIYDLTSNHIDLMQDAFENEITSADHARQIAQKHFPQIEAMACEIMLDHKTPRVSGSSGKNKPGRL